MLVVERLLYLAPAHTNSPCLRPLSSEVEACLVYVLWPLHVMYGLTANWGGCDSLSGANGTWSGSLDSCDFHVCRAVQAGRINFDLISVVFDPNRADPLYYHPGHECRAVKSYLQVICEQHRLVDQHIEKFSQGEEGGSAAPQARGKGVGGSGGQGVKLPRKGVHGCQPLHAHRP